MNFSIVIPIYNEELRIVKLLESLVKYTDDVIVINKASTDNSRLLIENKFSESVKIIDVTYSNRGEDDFKNYFSYSKYEWVFLAVASEITPDRFWDEFFLKLNKLKLSSYDLIMVPRLYNCFGFAVKNSPWDVSYFPFFLNKNTVIYSEKMHSHFTVSDESRRYYVELERENMIQHVTHVSLNAFIENTLSYASYECKNVNQIDVDETLCVWLNNMSEAYLRLKGSKGHGSFAHFAAWNIYWSVHILKLIENNRNLNSENDKALLKISVINIVATFLKVYYRNNLQNKAFYRKAKAIIFSLFKRS